MDKTSLYNVFEIITCDASIYTMDHPDFIACSFMEKPIGLKRVNMLSYPPYKHIPKQPGLQAAKPGTICLSKD